MEQLSFFDQDIRTEKQFGKRIAYDVGEKIAGSRKDEMVLKQAFEESQTLSNLNDLESVSPSLAAELVTKKQIFTFSLEREKEQGTEPAVARIKQLLLQRIDSTPSVDSAESRKNYLQAAKYYEEMMNPVRTFEEFKQTYRVISKKIQRELRPTKYLKERIQRLENSELSEQTRRELEDCRHYLTEINEANRIPLHCLGEKFVNFFTKSKSVNTTVRKVLETVESWDDLLKKSTKCSKTTQKGTTSWQRPIPDNPKRMNGRPVSIERPEELLDLFGFRGIQFGHYVEDSVAKLHLTSSTAAFMDLADILEINDTSLSLSGHLSMAYGARGRGNALGTYEPKHKIINLTKNRGLIGVLAHEWFHALDHYIYCTSYNFENGKVGYATEGNLGVNVPSCVIAAFDELMTVIKEGTAKDFIQNDNQAGTRWRVDTSFKKRYETFQGDLFEIMKDYQAVLREKTEQRLSFFSEYYRMEAEKERNKLERENQKKIRQYAQALAWYHEQQTGIREDRIPYSSDRSIFYQGAIEMDKGKCGKYWSKNRELAARAFEQYIYFKMEDNGHRNDYLVFSPLHSTAYPVEEERQKIFDRFDDLFNVLKRQLLLH